MLPTFRHCDIGRSQIFSVLSASESRPITLRTTISKCRWRPLKQKSIINPTQRTTRYFLRSVRQLYICSQGYHISPGPCGREEILNVSISVSFPPETPEIIHQGFMLCLSKAIFYQWKKLVMVALSDGVFAIPGSRVTGLFTWTRRDIAADSCGFSSVRGPLQFI